jgi:hypothetical protein
MVTRISLEFSFRVFLQTFRVDVIQWSRGNRSSGSQKMKYILSTLAFAFVLAAEQAPDRGDAIQTANDNRRSQSDRSTSHDRHMRKHRTTTHHHRRRTSAKGNTH